MLAAYLDESGMIPQDMIVAVAGFVAPTFMWEYFESRWADFLDQNGLVRFHAAPFLARRGEYATWSNAKYEQANVDIAEILDTLGEVATGVGTSVDVEAYERLRRTNKWELPGNPYYYCVERCLYELIFKIHEVPDEGVAIYCDLSKQYEPLGRQIAAWHANSLRRMPGRNAYGTNPGRTVSIRYESSVDYKPLQLADIAANGSFRWSKNPTGAPPLFIGCLNGLSYRTNFFNAPEQIDLDIRMRFGHATPPASGESEA